MGFGSFLSSLDPTKKGTWTSKAVAQLDPTNANAALGKVVSSDIGKGIISAAGAAVGVPPSLTFAGLKGLQVVGANNKANAEAKRAANDAAKYAEAVMPKINIDFPIASDPTAGIVTNGLSYKPMAVNNTTSGSIDWSKVGIEIIGKSAGVLDDNLSKSNPAYKTVKDKVATDNFKDLVLKYWYVSAAAVVGLTVLVIKAFSKKRNGRY